MSDYTPSEFAVQPAPERHDSWFWKAYPSHITGFLGGFAGWFAGQAIAGRFNQNISSAGDQDVIIGMVGILIGWLFGVGAFYHPFYWLIGKPQGSPVEEQHRGQGLWRYFKWNTDHKVIGVQYLVLTLFMLSVGGLTAMLIRAELYSPGALIFPPNTYETIVTMHGMLMIATMFSIIVGPFGNFFVPILIGATDMAFPRVNALSWHLLVVGVTCFMLIPFEGGVQTGWTFYSPLSDQNMPSASCFAFAIGVSLLSSSAGLINMLTTIITMRAPGMTWTRLPLFVWGIIGTAILSAYSAPAWIADFVEILLDRGWRSTFFIDSVPTTGGGAGFYGKTGLTFAGGGNAYLYEVVFWFFGHPEVYILAIPGWAMLMEVTTVFARKTAFTYKLGVIGILGVAGNSFLVWGHHLFASGWETQLRGYYMFTTETISIPTGFIFLVIIGTIWRGELWMKIPLAWVFAFLWTFVIGGTTGIYLSDVPLDILLHGSYFVAAHFHYTILGSILWGFFAGIYYWFPKMTGRYLDETLGWIHFWGVQIFFNITFLTLFYVGLIDMPRRVADYPHIMDFANRLASISAFFLGAAMVVFLVNVIWSWFYGDKAGDNAWGAQTLEWQLPTPVPVENYERIPVVTAGPYEWRRNPERAVPAAHGGQEAGM